MIWPEAQRLQRKSYCDATELCKTKQPVIRMQAEGYYVACPVSDDHELRISRSMFSEYLERWHHGIFDGTGMEGLLFVNMLRSMERKEPKWNYQLDDKGRLVRIGREWAPWFIAAEKE